MYSALQLAELAMEEDEVPIGAVVVHKNRIIGKGYNQTGRLNDPTAHAEIIAITSAANHLKSKFLTDCDIYITAEPCIMCAGAILLSRINKVYFGTFEPKFGASGSLYNLLEENKYNHKPDVYSGILAEESNRLLKKYFESKRKLEEK
ncbi:MAG: nucleoside deaminase [Ignavibacteria bacterium]|nr:MAG: nucleoside deaminase [Ignavibacteria bacterium]